MQCRNEDVSALRFLGVKLVIQRMVADAPWCVPTSGEKFRWGEEVRGERVILGGGLAEELFGDFSALPDEVDARGGVGDTDAMKVVVFGGGGGVDCFNGDVFET